MIQEFNYEIGGRVAGHRPGHHRGDGSGSGFEFRELASLAADPDARRLDLHASVRDPFGELKVRVFRERRSITVQVLADLSASMGVGRPRRKLDVLGEFAQAAAYSAQRTGDAFGFAGAAEVVDSAMRVLPTRAPGWGAWVAERCAQFQPSGRTAAGLCEAAGGLGRRRCLVFVVSDFHFPLALGDELLNALTAHDVVPVVLWDPLEHALPGRSGLFSVRDSETGAARRLVLRPAFAARVRQHFQERQRLLKALFTRHGMRPLVFSRGFDAALVTEYFAGGNDWPDIAG